MNNNLASRWRVFVAVAVFALALFVIIIVASIKDDEARGRCKASGGQVITGVGYMGRGWMCQRRPKEE